MRSAREDTTWFSQRGKKEEYKSLQQSVEQAIRKYLEDLDGELPNNLFDTVISEIEQPMLKDRASSLRQQPVEDRACLGINRGTLRKKLKQYHIEH